MRDSWPCSRPAKRGRSSKSRAEPSSRATTTRASSRARTISAISARAAFIATRGRLEDRGVGIAIDHQAGETIALGVGDAIGIAVEAHRQAQLQRGAQPLVDEVGQARRLRLGRAADHPQRQAGARRPGRPAEPLAAPVFDGDRADRRRPRRALARG